MTQEEEGNTFLKNPWNMLSQIQQVIVVININQLFFTACFVFIKKATAIGVHPFDLTMIRSFSNLCLSIPLIRKFGKHPLYDIPKELRCTMAARCLIGTVCFFFIVLTGMFLPIFIAQTIMNTMPFWSGVFAYLINKEKIKKAMIVCMIGSFAGVFVLNMYRPDKQSAMSKVQNNLYGYGIMTAITFAILGALVGVLNRKMKAVHFSIIQIDYALTAWLCLFVVVLIEYALLHNDKEKYPYKRIRFLTYGFEEWVWILCYCAFNFFVQLTFNIGSTRGKSSFVSLIMQIGVVWGFTADSLILKH